MFKSLAITSLALILSSCSWLASHPQIEADLTKIETDARQDIKTTLDDILVPESSPTGPVEAPKSVTP